MSAVQDRQGHGVFPANSCSRGGPMLPGSPVEAGAAVVRLRRNARSVCLTLLPVPPGLSPRLAAIVNALPFAPHSRVLEIGCGPGAAARAVAARLVTGHILATDRSASAIAQARAAAAEQITAGV